MFCCDVVCSHTEKIDIGVVTIVTPHARASMCNRMFVCYCYFVSIFLFIFFYFLFFFSFKFNAIAMANQTALDVTTVRVLDLVILFSFNCFLQKHDVALISLTFQSLAGVEVHSSFKCSLKLIFINGVEPQNGYFDSVLIKSIVIRTVIFIFYFFLLFIISSLLLLSFWIFYGIIYSR